MHRAAPLLWKMRSCVAGSAALELPAARLQSVCTAGCTAAECLNCRLHGCRLFELPAARLFMHFFLTETGKPHKKSENKKNCGNRLERLL